MVTMSVSTPEMTPAVHAFLIAFSACSWSIGAPFGRGPFVLERIKKHGNDSICAPARQAAPRAFRAEGEIDFPSLNLGPAPYIMGIVSTNRSVAQGRFS